MTAAKKQIANFKTAARELGCSDDKNVFEEKLRRIARTKPKPKTGTRNISLKKRSREPC